MTTPEYVTLPDFIVFIDRAGHAVAEQVDGDGNTVRGVDFGFSTPQANVINVFVDADQETRDALAPAVNVYLLGLIAK